MNSEVVEAPMETHVSSAVVKVRHKSEVLRLRVGWPLDATEVLAIVSEAFQHCEKLPIFLYHSTHGRLLELCEANAQDFIARHDDPVQAIRLETVARHVAGFSSQQSVSKPVAAVETAAGSDSRVLGGHAADCNDSADVHVDASRNGGAEAFLFTCPPANGDGRSNSDAPTDMGTTAGPATGLAASSAQDLPRPGISLPVAARKAADALGDVPGAARKAADAIGDALDALGALG
jgi:hypothetical protein